MGTIVSVGSMIGAGKPRWNRPPALVPADGRACWLRGDAGSMFKDILGTIPATTNGDQVVSWKDRDTGAINVKGNWNGAMYSFGTLVVSDPIANGRSSLSFADSQVMAFIPTLTVPFTVFCVWHSSQTTYNGRVLTDPSDNSWLIGNMGHPYGVPSMVLYCSGSAVYAPRTVGQCCIQAVSQTSAVARVYDRASSFPGVLVSPSSPTGGVLSVNSGESMLGGVAEIIVYDRVLSDSDFAQTVAYLCDWYSQPAAPILWPVDGDMQAPNTIAWTSSGQAILTKETASPHDGVRYLNIAAGGYYSYAYAYQPGILVVGRTCRCRGWARGDGVRAPVIYLYSTKLICGTASTDWRWFDVTGICTGGADLYLGFEGGNSGSVAFNSVSLTDVTP